MGSVGKAIEVFQRYKKGTFLYGSADCCTFARDIIEARYGTVVEYPAMYDGSISSIRENFKCTGTIKLIDFLTEIAKLNKWKRVWNKWLQNYDLVIVRQGRRYMAGVWISGKAWVPGKQGLESFSREYVSWGYRTGV